LEHLKMFEPERDGAFSPDQLSQEWASWLPDETILVSWDSLPFRHPCGFPAHMVDRQISVKDVWYNNFRDRRGHVEDLARHYCRDQFYLGDDIEGRPKMRLEALITIVWYLMEHDRLIRVGSHTD
ncbi:MAG: hypothetical protein VYA34_11890, partial [Myxococcota bacterium]|nr:hypothetical protein [Myxococcota bacterium]